MVTDFMGIRNESFMKVAAVGTWMGDFVTAWMVSGGKGKVEPEKCNW